MTIKEAAKRSGLPAKTIRYHEEIGLVRPVRDANRYRVFNENDILILSLLGSARDLGFTIDECREILSLFPENRPASGAARSVADSLRRVIDTKAAQARSLQTALARLIASCERGDRQDCPECDTFAEDTADGKLQ